MHFIFGGRHMGKLAYAKSLLLGVSVCDLAVDAPENMFHAGIIVNVQLLVKDLLKNGDSPTAFFQRNVKALHGKIVIGDEIGSGIVPMEPFEREWRDETGRVYQLLAQSASDVTRVWAGLPQALKREGE